MRRRLLLNQDTKPSGALYWYGDECIDKTGGWNEFYAWTTSYWKGDYKKGILTKNANNIYLKAQGSSQITSIGVNTSNNINLTNYSSLKMLIDTTNLATRLKMFGFWLTQDLISVSEPSKTSTYWIDNSNIREINFNISTYNDSYYILPFISREGSGLENPNDVKIYGIWLE